MLMARGQMHIGEADLRWAVVFAPALWCVVVEREGLVLDTRFVPPAADAARPTMCLYLLLRGTFVVHGEPGQRFEAPAAFVLSDEQIEGARGARSLTFSASGRPYAAIELHFRASDVTVRPSAGAALHPLDAATWDAARAVARLAPDDDAFHRHVTALVERVSATGVLTPEAAARALEGPSKAFAHLWRALRPMVERFYLTPTLQEVGNATGLSLRQVDRYIQAFVTSFALVGEGWRPATRHLRLKLAVLLLSAGGASVAEVAAAVGYRSADAMARAFRDAGLRAPSAVQADLRALG